jgi:translation initiation factor IF-3
MRISRKKRPDKPLIAHYRKNHEIDSPEVLLLDEEGKRVGVLTSSAARALAEEKELDLVEINPKNDPPVVKLINFAEFKYQKEKEARKQKAHSHVSETKGIRLSIRIGDHDLSIKAGQAEKFLLRGDKVRLEVVLKGRENARGDLANEIIETMLGKLEPSIPVKFEQEITRQGKKVTAVIVRK